MKTHQRPHLRCRLSMIAMDVTPPAGIHSRSWGASLHETAEGIHRPFQATALVLEPLSGGSPPLAVVGMDLGWLEPEESEELLQRIREGAGLEPSQLMVALSHTHAGPNVTFSLAGRPGGHLIRRYFEQIVVSSVQAIRQARDSLQEGWVVFGNARCGLAANRDAWDEETGQFVCGFNPQVPADDTVLVARLFSAEGRTLGILVNYGCHPTTLGPENRLLSPDYVGATRELLEQHFKAAVLFLLGPCGDTAPYEGYVRDPAVADRHGRQLGLAAASGLEALAAPGQEMYYEGPIVSGATLGGWNYRPLSEEALQRARVIRGRVVRLELPLKPKAPLSVLQKRHRMAELEVEGARAAGDATRLRDATALLERARRHLLRVPQLPPGETQPLDLWIWQLGDAFLVGIPGEPYSALQIQLRQRFPRRPILIGSVTNGTVAYLLPRHLYGTGLYQDWVSLVGPGCFELVLETVSDAIREWVSTGWNERERG